MSGTVDWLRFFSFVKAPDNIKDEVVLVRSGEYLLLHFAQHLRLASTSNDVESIKIAVQVRRAFLFLLPLCVVALILNIKDKHKLYII